MLSYWLHFHTVLRSVEQTSYFHIYIYIMIETEIKKIYIILCKIIKLFWDQILIMFAHRRIFNFLIIIYVTSLKPVGRQVVFFGSWTRL